MQVWHAQVFGTAERLAPHRKAHFNVCPGLRRAIGATQG
jgi:hypothetical protein